MAVVICGTLWGLTQLTANRQKENQPPRYALRVQDLDTTIMQSINEYRSLDMSVAIVDLQTGKHYNYGDNSSFTAASVSKLITASLFLHKVELGQVDLTDTIGTDTARTALEKLLVESDNTAWHNFNALLTDEGLESYARTQGLNSYDASSNTLTTEDTARLLHRLSQGKLLNNTNTKLMLSFMKRADMRNFLVAGAPASATTYHKVGYLSDRLHDAAIIQDGDRSFILVVFTKSGGSYDFGQGAVLFQTLAQKTSDAFFAD